MSKRVDHLLRIIERETLPDDLATWMLRDKDPRVRAAMVRHWGGNLYMKNDTPPFEMEEEACADSDPRVRAALAATTQNQSLLLTLASDGDEEVQLAVAGSTYATAEVLQVLLDEGSGPVIDRLSQNRALTGEQVRTLLDKDVPTALDNQQAMDRFFAVFTNQDQLRASNLARLPNLPSDVVDLLIAQRHSWTQRILAQRDHLHPAQYFALLDEGNEDVWVALAGNECAPVTLLQELSLRLEQMETATRLLRDDWLLAGALATNPSATKPVLDSLVSVLSSPARSEFLSVQTAVARNLACHPNLGAVSATLLARSKVVDVQRAAACSSSTPLPVVLELLKHRSPEVQLAALSNPELPDSALESVADNGKSKWGRTWVRQRAQDILDRRVRARRAGS